MLRVAHLEGAWLHDTHLESARLHGVYLNNAWLLGTHLQKADLNIAHLQGTRFSADQEQANLKEAKLEGAEATLKTTWPKGFNWRAAGVILVDDEGKLINRRDQSPG